nr:hypothetical protein [Halorhodospira halophila]
MTHHVLIGHIQDIDLDHVHMGDQPMALILVEDVVIKCQAIPPRSKPFQALEQFLVRLNVLEQLKDDLVLVEGNDFLDEKAPREVDVCGMIAGKLRHPEGEERVLHNTGRSSITILEIRMIGITLAIEQLIAAHLKIAIVDGRNCPVDPVWMGGSGRCSLSRLAYAA